MRPLVPAAFVARPNRFVVRARLSDGPIVRAHLADPGRLRELLVRGAALRLRAAAGSSGRRTRWSVALVRASGRPVVWVSLDSGLPNRLAEDLLRRGLVPGLPFPAAVRREVVHGASRFDFSVDAGDGAPWLVEVKSVTLVEDGTARFPDAPTVRGARHVRELAERARAGGRAAVLFVVQRHDARGVTSNPATDAAFAEALADAERDGVLLRAARFRLDPRGRAAFEGMVPVSPAPASGPRSSRRDAPAPPTAAAAPAGTSTPAPRSSGGARSGSRPRPATSHGRRASPGG